MEATKQIFAKDKRNNTLMEIVHSTQTLETVNQLADEVLRGGIPTKKEQTGLIIIYNHKGKRKAYEFYRSYKPEMAIMYLKFISENCWAQYITWDDIHKRFVG